MLRVTIHKKDEEDKEVFECVDYPGTGDYIILYMKGLKRVLVSKEDVIKIDCEPI